MSIDTAVAGLKADVRKLEKEIEDCKFWHDHHREKYGPLRIKLERERLIKLNQIGELEASRPMDERRGWRPSSGGFVGSNW